VQYLRSIFPCDELQDFALAFCEGWEDFFRQRGYLCCEEIDQARGYGWAEDRFAIPDCLNGAQNIFLFRVFEDVSTGTGPHCSKNRTIILEHRNDQNANMQRVVQNSARRFDAVDVWHINIHQDHIGMK
jgi:hypothetical protein